MDWIDVLLKIGTFATFIVFGIAIWLIKKGADKKKASQDLEDKNRRLP
jgi:hypothetical protein